MRFLQKNSQIRIFRYKKNYERLLSQNTEKYCFRKYPIIQNIMKYCFRKYPIFWHLLQGFIYKQF